MDRTYIKICGLTTIEQTKASLDLGADWLGFNFYSKSKRYIAPEKVYEIVKTLPCDTVTVGLFVNETAESVNKIMEYTSLTVAQLHGDETSNYIQGLNSPYFKAFRVSSEFQTEIIPTFNCDQFLLDSYHPNLYGGTGDSFNWEIAKEAKQFGKLILAGGLDINNVGQAVTTVQPYAVDVCSSVEEMPGVKDMNLVKNFISEVRKADVIIHSQDH